MAIVCGVDFSEPSGRAAAVAARLAVAWKEELWLAHVREDRPATLRERDEEERSRARAKLEAEARGLPGNVEVRAVLLEGIPDEQLLRFAHEKGARLLIVASLGRRSSERTRLGSVAERLCRSGDLPVLVIRDSRPLERWLEGRAPLKVLLALEGGPSSARAVQWTTELRRLHDADTTVVRFYWAPGESRRFGISGPFDLTGPNPKVDALIESELARQTRRLEGRGSVDLRVCASPARPSEGVLELSLELGSDLVVVGSHVRSLPERLWFGSVSQAVVHGADASVLRVPGGSENMTGVTDVGRVLVPVDFSDVSRRAIGRAFSVLAPGGVVRILHVVSPRGSTEGDEALRERLQGLIPAEALERGLRGEVEVVKNDHAAEAIRQAAERFDADFICMGTSGQSRVLRAALGSVADAVVRQSPRPVILVKPAPKE